jgi:uncharacterized membrane protein
MMNRVTTLGLDERVESVLAYALMGFSGLFLLLAEKNRNVRWHAAQSLVTFGIIWLLFFALKALQGFLKLIPLIGGLLSFGPNLLATLVLWLVILLWLWLMLMAWLRSDYRLPFFSSLADLLA